jgi:hypothetical protein
MLLVREMKSLIVITALPLTSASDKVDQLTLKDEDLLVPINVVRSTVVKSLPLMYVRTYFHYRLSIVYLGNNCCFESSDHIYSCILSQYIKYYVVYSHLFNYSSYV